MTILKMYVTLMPVIFAGAANMVFTKTSLYKKYSEPIDGNKTLKDNRRIFGNNKTWAGFCGMIFFGGIFQVIWGWACALFNQLYLLNQMYISSPNTWIFNFAAGTLFGFAYVLCELPNSFIKRRLDIVPGKTANGLKGMIFFVVDQIDSLIGVVFVLSFICDITFAEYCLYILLGAFTHILINLILYMLKIRKNI